LGFEVTNPEDTESKLNSLKLHHDIVLAKEDFENGNPQLLNQYIATAEKARANFSFGSEKNKNEVLKNAYYNPEFIDQLKFSFTGALAFNEAELKQMKADSAFSSFINAKSDIAKDKSKYFLEYGGTNYSRAEGFYSTEKKAVGIENPLERFNLLSANIKELLFFLNKIEKFIFSEQNNLTSVEWKLSIAFYDNLKSNLLHLFHAFSYLKTQGFVEDNELNNKLNEELRKSVEGVVGNYFDLINLQSPKVFYSDSLNNLVDQASIAVEQALEKGVESKAVSKSIRGIMEADSPAQVNIFANNIAEEIVSEHPNRKIVLIGLHFGGAELPYAIQSALKRRNSDVNVEIVSAHYSNYSNKDARFNNGYFDKQLDLTDSDVFLLDDGVFTGGSLAKVVDELARFGANVLPRTMQVGNSRRLGHMQKSGGVNPSFLETQIVRNAVGITPSARAMTKEKFEQLEAEDKFNLMQMRVSQMTKAYYTKEEK
jgi:pyrimidine operon attenuation protein/uracil phosphoribosyltransferase